MARTVAAWGLSIVQATADAHNATINTAALQTAAPLQISFRQQLPPATTEAIPRSSFAHEPRRSE